MAAKCQRLQKHLVIFHFFGYFCHVNTVEDIEQAVEKLPPEDLAKLTVWLDQYRAKSVNHPAGNVKKSSEDWFNIYMTCPDTFEIPPRKKQFYKPSE